LCAFYIVLHWKASTWLPNALLATGEASGEPWKQRQGAEIGNPTEAFGIFVQYWMGFDLAIETLLI